MCKVSVFPFVICVFLRIEIITHHHHVIIPSPPFLHQPCYKKLFSLRGSYNDVAAANASHVATAPATAATAAAATVVAVPAAVVAVAQVDVQLMKKPSSPQSVVAAPVAPAPAPEVVTVKPVERVAPSPVKPAGLGLGGGIKCSVCTKSIYAADPQFNADGKIFHKNCFKCLVCKSQLGLSSLAQIEGMCVCKTCYQAEFKMRGKVRMEKREERDKHDIFIQH